MTTRRMVSISILVLMVTLIPGILRAAEVPSSAQPAAPAVTAAPVPAVAGAPVPGAETLPLWQPALDQQSRIPGEVVHAPIFLISCSSCVPAIKCFKTRACILAGCC